jgi:PAS domain S-box-containing protein
MRFSEIIILVTGLLQFVVAGYALRLNRIFGTARVGWSLFWAFALLALLHLIQSVTAVNNGAFMGTETEVIYALIALLLLTGMVHLETVLKERLRLEQEEKRMRDGLEMLVNDKTAHLSKAIEDLQLEITERKKAEAQISEQARMLDLAPDAIMVRDLKDQILYWNKSAERIYGWTASEALGQKAEELLHKDVFNASKYKEAGKAVMEKGDWQGAFITQTKTRQEVMVEARWTLIRDPQGTPKSILAISTDVTEKKKLEAQFLRSQRMECLGTLAGGIGHDLNNVLTPLLVSIEVLKGRTDAADRQKLLEALEANVQRGAGLVKQVLAFGRGLEGERAMIQPKHIVREIKQIVQQTFPKSIEFEFHSTPDAWTIIGDPTQLYQVLLNLCVNARDAMPGGGKLSIGLENVTFDETYVGMNLEARVGPYVLIQVTDTGTGIPRKIQERIFDPYFTTKEPGKGTGLGLSTTLAIVKSHGGFIHCQSAPGQGATFQVYLPASIAPVAEKTAEDLSKLWRGHDELVLIVDDEEPILKIAQKTLERFGYRVLVAADGAEAVSLYISRQQEIAVVITDVAMPHMDGPATIAALKTINPKVKIIGSSGLTSDGGRARIKNAGIEHFIPKPYKAEAILQVLHEVLQKKPAK